MYVKFNIESTTVGTYVAMSKFKHDFLRWWPPKWVDGIEVMDRLYFYNGHVLDDTQHKKVYKLVGTDATTLRAGEYKGVERCWLYLKPWTIVNEPIEDFQVEDALQSMATDVETRLQIEFEYEENPTTTANWNSATTPILKSSVELLAEFQAARVDGNYRKIFYNDKAADYSLFAIMDNTNTYFDVTSSIVGKGTRTVYITTTSYDMEVISKKIITVAYINFAFKRKTTLPQVAATYIAKIKTIPLDLLSVSMSLEYTRLYQSYMPVTASELFYKGYIRKDGLRAMKLDPFKRAIGKAIKSDYDEEEAEWWEKAIAVVITVVVVVVALILAAPSGGYSLASLPAAFASIGAVTAALAASALVLAGIGMAFSRIGRYGFAAEMGNASMTLNKVAEILGYITIILGITTIIQQGFTKAMTAEAAKAAGKEAAKDAAGNVIVNAAGMVTVSMTPTEIGFQVIKWMNTGFGMWSKYQASKEQEQLSELQRKVTEQEEAINDLPTPKKYEVEQDMFENYRYLEINEMMGEYVDMSTNVDKFTGKYF